MIINNVPKEAEDAVRKMAMIAIERHLRPKIADIKIKAFEDDIDAVLVANNLPKKYDVPEERFNNDKISGPVS